jgi:hypothetical protein
MTDQPELPFRMRDAVTSALRYWEPRRLIYNGVLAAVVLIYFFINLPSSSKAVSFDGVLFLFILAVLANVAYCAVYPGDVFVQFSGFRPLLLKFRWVVLTIGSTFAAIITRFFALGFFSR